MVAGSVPKAYDIVMEKASASWVGELSRTRTEFAALKRRLSEVVRRHNNNTSATTTQPIPDPVRLLERMSTLEASLDQLEVDCREVCTKRQTLAKETADALLRNAQLIQDLSARTGCDDIGDTGVDGDIGHDRFWTEDLAELAKQRDALHNMPALASSSSGNEGAT